MSYRNRECRICHGNMDPEEGYGGVCDECIQMESEKLKRNETLKTLFDPRIQVQFKQMRMEDFING